MQMPRWNGIGKPPALHLNTATKIRDKYRAIWSQDWPHDDRYLNELWFEAGDEAARLNDRYALVLNAMRENDSTIPPEYGRVAEPASTTVEN
jgi:hypothetical protein